MLEGHEIMLKSTFRVGCSFYDMEQSHVGNIINVNFGFEYNDKGLAIQLDGEN
jgi:hypothetical protein